MHRIWPALALFVLIPFSAARADEAKDRRVEAGARLFRALLAADLDIQKKTLPPNQLLIVFTYEGDATRAAALANSFAGTEIHGLPVIAEAVASHALPTLGARVPAGIFIADTLPRGPLQSVIRYGIDHRVIVYSPFDGDVESGVLGGLSIEAQVRPFINHATLDASHITLKPFFLKVAKVFE